MKILFIHQNFPGQFRHLATALARQGHEVVAVGIHDNGPALPGVAYIRYKPDDRSVKSAGLRWAELDRHLNRGLACQAALLALKARGFEPQIVLAHSGWGEAWFLKDVFPHAHLCVYAEYYYGSPTGDADFDPEFPGLPAAERAVRLRVKNTHLLHALAVADSAWSPTEFQRSQHPEWAQQRIKVIHEGIDTQRFRPDPKAMVKLKAASIEFRPGDEVVTFAARHLEPYRGYHQFIRALPVLQKLNPRVRVVIVGGDGVSYGAAPPKGTTWKDHFLAEVQQRLDMSRVHFVGHLPHSVLTQLMQVSAVHVYLTYPFVLSWSMLEAMSVGCLMVASDTAPVREVIRHGQNGWLVDFFDPEAMAHRIDAALASRSTEGLVLREQARQTVIERYDLKTSCLPQQLQWVGQMQPGYSVAP